MRVYEVHGVSRANFEECRRPECGCHAAQRIYRLLGTLLAHDVVEALDRAQVEFDSFAREDEIIAIGPNDRAPTSWELIAHATV